VSDDKIVIAPRTAVASVARPASIAGPETCRRAGAAHRPPEVHFLRPEELPFSWLAVVTRQQLGMQVGV